MFRLKLHAAMFAVIIGLLMTFNQTARAESWSWENILSVFSSANAVVDCTTNPIVVNNLDSGAGSLRQAVIDACPGSTITFDSAVTGLIYQSGQIVIDKNLTIEGPGAGVLTIRSVGGFVSTNRIFSVNQYATVTISGLSMTGARSAGIMNWGGNLTVTNSSVSGNPGGGIFTFTNSTTTISNSTVSGNYSVGISNSGTMTIANSTVSNNFSEGDGGAGIANRGTLIVTSSTISGNYGSEATVEGGGLYNNGTATVTNSTVSNNSLSRNYEASPTAGGAGIGNDGGTLTLINSTVANNTINTATMNGAIGPGAGIHQRGGTVIVRNSIIAGNTSTRRTQQGPFIPSVLDTRGDRFRRHNDFGGLQPARRQW